MVKTQAAATDTIYLQAVTQALPCFLCCVCYCVVAVHRPWWLLLWHDTSFVTKPPGPPPQKNVGSNAVVKCGF